MSAETYLTGLLTGLSLIVAIGAQNAFVLRQGLMNEYVFAVCLACALSDAALIVIGVGGFERLVLLMPWLVAAMRYGGAAFLIAYGAQNLKSALRSSGALEFEKGRSSTVRKTLAACLALTWLNPHVYLDTLALLGAVSTRFPGREASFAAGAITGSFVFFFSLGYGATRLGPIFASPSSWRILETVVAFTMWTIAFQLLHGL